VIDLLVDVVARDGNLLLNLPLRPDGTLDEEELAILDEITAWMKVNGEAIHGTRPWKVLGDGPNMKYADAGGEMARLSAGHFNEKPRPQNSWVSGSSVELLKALLLIRKPLCANNFQVLLTC